MVQSLEKQKKDKFEDFDTQLYEIECGNRRVEDELTYWIDKNFNKYWIDKNFNKDSWFDSFIFSFDMLLSH